jgi:hypothetical protein
MVNRLKQQDSDRLAFSTEANYSYVPDDTEYNVREYLDTLPSLVMNTSALDGYVMSQTSGV